MTVVMILEAALELPLSQALVRLPEIKDSYYNTAFTLALIRGIFLCTTVYIVALPFATFYRHQELIPLIEFLALALAARGSRNLRLAYFAKNLNFKYEFIFELIGKVTAFAAGHHYRLPDPFLLVDRRLHGHRAAGHCAAILCAISLPLTSYLGRLADLHGFSGLD